MKKEMGRKTVALVVSLWVIPVSILVNRIVPHPYMDEIFHVPQAQQYCKANFTSWDPMITTPPGLYLVSLAHVASLFPGILCLKAAASFSDACSPSILRSTNGLLAVICSVLIFEIITNLRPAVEDRKATLSAVVLSLYPLHWFFNFLFYTDVASLTAVLASYLMVLKGSYWISALLGAFAVFVRQTNIIWILFVACIGVINLTLVQQKHKKLDNSNLSQAKATQYAYRTSSRFSNLRMRRSDIRVDPCNNIDSPETIRSFPDYEGLFGEIQDLISASWQLKWKLLSSFSLFVLNLLAFVAFVCWNGSIVLGAKDAHTMSPHLAQMLYFSLVSACFMFPVLMSWYHVVALARSFMKNKLFNVFKLVIGLLAGFLSMHFFSIAHPYLLADNRHYTFYFWRKVIKSHYLTKYLLVPLSVYSWFSICSILAKTQKKIWVVAFFLATAATLIPAPLIEFRYYTVPFFFLILHAHVDDGMSWILMGLLYGAINLFTMFMFLSRPFSWDHEPGAQRFIW